MGNNSAWVVVAGNGIAYSALVGSTAPTNATSSPAAAFELLGYISDEGATFTEGKEITDINAWQSFYPIRKIVSSRSVEVSFALREFNRRAVQFALGGTITGTAPGPYSYTPPPPESLNTKAFILDWIDGSKNYRLYIPQCLVTETVETTLSRTASADLPVTLAALDSGGSIYTLFTNDPAFSS